MDTAVKPADRPDGREPGEEPGEAWGPCGQVIGMREDVFRGVEIVFPTDGEGDNGGGYEDKIRAGVSQFVASQCE